MPVAGVKRRSAERRDREESDDREVSKGREKARISARDGATYGGEGGRWVAEGRSKGSGTRRGWTTNKAPSEETENIVRFAALSRPYGDRRISY